MDKENKLTHGRTSVYHLSYHIVWGTKYRNKVLNGKVEEDLKGILFQIAKDKEFQITHMEIGLDDHIHLLISTPPKLSVTSIVKWLKGISARQLFVLHPELKTAYWKPIDRHLWSPSYFVESIGITNREAVETYIENQRKKEVSLNKD